MNRSITVYIILRKSDVTYMDVYGTLPEAELALEQYANMGVPCRIRYEQIYLEG